MKKIFSFLLFSGLVVSIGCGVKGSPKPPTNPSQVHITNMSAKQQGNILVFYWYLDKNLSTNQINIFVNGKLQHNIKIHKLQKLYWIDYKFKQLNKEYCYKLKIKDTFSNVKCIIPHKYKHINDKLNLMLKNNGILLKWNNNYPKVNIYRGNDFDKIKPIPYKSLKNSHKFLDTNIKLNTRYCYYFTATIDSIETNRVYSDCIIFKDIYPPKPPKNLTYIINGKDLLIIWDYPDNKDLKGFIIYKNGQPYLRFVLNSYYFIDKNWKKGDEYLIFSVDKAGNKSKPAYLKIE